MLISVVNHTNGRLSDEEIQEGIRAVNRQITHDFKPYWHIAAELRLEGSIGKNANADTLPELRGDAISLEFSVFSTPSLASMRPSRSKAMPERGNACGSSPK
jgi:hypothetical protein